MDLPEHQNSKKYFIKTFGCQMNVADTERMSALLGERGMTPARGASDADVIIINGCTVREKAVHKAVSALGELQTLKKGKTGWNPATNRPDGPIIGIGGCVGQLDKGKLFARAPYLDFVFGTDTIDNLPEIVSRIENGERHVVYADFDKSMDYSTETKVHARKAQAYVNIMKGCDKYCTYCIVPFTRGKEKSRLIDEVVNDVARLVAMGVREVTLLGQNVNSFGKGNPNVKGRAPLELHNVIGKVGPKAGDENFPQLLRALDSDPRCAALRRIRFTSSHPLDFSDELIECYAPADRGGVARLSGNLHLPVQSGSNTVLQRMGRHHKIEGYIAQMDRLRELRPDIGLSTDLIVGFPTETEEDFQETLRLLDRVQYDNIYAFAYSPRPGTRAAKLPDDVPLKVKKDRLNRLLQYQLRIAEKRYASRIGRVMEVLVEGRAKHQNMAAGQDAVVHDVEPATVGGIDAAGAAGAHVAAGVNAPAGSHVGTGPDTAAGESAPTGSNVGTAPDTAAGESALAGSYVRTASSAAAAAGRVWTGRSDCNRVVNFISDSPRDLTGRFVEVRILAATGLSLHGEPVEDAAAAESLAPSKEPVRNVASEATRQGLRAQAPRGGAP